MAARAGRDRWHRVSAGVGVAVLAGALVVTAGMKGYPADRPRLLSGAAWLASSQVGQVTLLDGSSAEVAAQVSVAAKGERLDVVQQGSTAYVVNRSAGSLRRVDGATFEVSAPVTPVDDARGGLVAFAGPHGLYALDTQGGLVSLAVQIEAQAATVDEAGRLWVLDTATGDLIWLDRGTRHLRRAAASSGAGLLTLADGAPVLVDTARRTAARLDPKTGATRSVTVLDMRAGERVQVAGSPHFPRLYLTAARGVLSVCELTADSCGTVVPLAADSTDLGPPVETSGRVFVPDYTTGRVWIVDLRDKRIVASPRVLSPQTRFQLLVRDGLVFFNDPDGPDAGVIRLDGGVRTVTKYDPKDPDGGLDHPGGQTGLGKAGSDQPVDQPPPNPPGTTPSRQPEPPPVERPTVRIVVSTVEPFVGDPVNLQAVGAPGKPQPTGARWDFGDGQTASGVRATHQWDAPRTYQVSVQATFPGNRTATTSVTIRVVTRPVTRPVLTVQRPVSGTITGPNGISCPGTCTATFDPGQRVTLTAQPTAPNVQLSWGGACGGTAAGTPCTVTMTANRTVSATFGSPTVALTVIPPTNGRVTGNGGINCPGTCTATFSPGTRITLTATPDPGFGVLSWGGDCGGRTRTCTLAMTTNRTVSVRFDTRKTLNVSVTQFEPDGGAGVQGPGGLFCQANCTWTFDPGQRITLTAVDQGLDFLGWGGDCAARGTNPTCTLTMDRNRSVSVRFDIL